jgi:hypothetical protein
MIWITIGLLLLAIAIGVTLAFVVLRGSARQPIVLIPVALALCVALAALMHFYVTPKVLVAWAEDRARDELLAVPVYAVLQKYEPTVFERLVLEYRLVVIDRSRIGAFTDEANTQVSEVASRHIAQSSDAALLGLMNDMLQRLQLLRAKSPDDCYRYLYSDVAGPPDIGKHFDRASQERTLALMAEVIRTSVEQPAPGAPTERAQALLAPIVQAMNAEYGENTQLLSHAKEPGVDRRMVCNVSVALYEKMMALPQADAAAVVRVMSQL